MALVVADRVKQTAASITGVGTYTLSGTFTGFQTFTEGVGDGNTTYYAAVDGANFEIGIGTYTASGTTLARTTILQSSNSDNAVSWSSATPTIFTTYPADKAVFLDASDDLTFTGASFNAVWDKSDNALEFGDGAEARFGSANDLRILHAGGSSIIRDQQSNPLYLQTDNTIHLTNKFATEHMAKFISDGAVELYHNGIKKIETTSTGIDVTGNATLTSTDAGATADPTLTLYRNSSSPADSDDLGEIIFKGRNDNSQDVEYSKIFAELRDVSDGTEDGGLKFEVMRAGTSSVVLEMRGTGDTIFSTNNVRIDSGINLKFEGATGDAHETTIAVVDPTADRTITLPDATGTIALTSDLSSFSGSSNITTVGALTGLQLTAVVNNNATLSPTLTIERNDPVPADFAKAGQIVFKGTNSASEQIEYASIEMNTDDVTDSTEDGRLRVNVIKAGTKTAIVDATSTAFQLRNSIPLAWQNAGGSGVHTSLQVVTPTSSRTISLPDATGQVVLSSGAINTDASSEIGRAHVGHVGFSDIAGFSHVDQNNTSNYALLHQSDGTTYLNAPTGKNVKIRNNNTNIADFNSGGLYLYSTKIIAFEGSASNAFETSLTVAGPTADRTITLPDAGGTVVVSASFPLSISSAGNMSLSAVPVAADNITTGDAAVTIATTTGNITIDAQAQNSDVIIKGNNGGFTVNAATFDMSNSGQLILSNGISSSGGMPISCTNGNIEIDCQSQDNDIVFKGNDGGSTITALTLDMSNDGNATFNSNLGVGTSTSSVWVGQVPASVNAIDVSGKGGILGYTGSSGTDGETIISTNAFYTNSGWKAKQTGEASGYSQKQDGSHRFYGTNGTSSNINTTVTFNELFKIESGGAEIYGNTAGGYLQLNCEANTHGVKIQSPDHSAGQSYTLKLPDNQIAADKILKVKSITGSGATAVGQLEFADDASGGGGGSSLTLVSNSGGTLNLQNGATSVFDGNVLGTIQFNAPNESSGTDANEIAAAIVAEADNQFSASFNSTDLVFKLGVSGPATEKMRLTHEGGLTLNNAYTLPTSDGNANQVLQTNGSGTLSFATVSGGGGGGVTVQDEGSALSTTATTLDFVGAGVVASGTGATKTVTIAGGGSGITVQDEGSALSTAGTTLNFVGAGVTASGTGATKTVTISGGGGGGGITTGKAIAMAMIFG